MTLNEAKNLLVDTEDKITSLLNYLEAQIGGTVEEVDVSCRDLNSREKCIAFTKIKFEFDNKFIKEGINYGNNCWTL